MPENQRLRFTNMSQTPVTESTTRSKTSASRATPKYPGVAFFNHLAEVADNFAEVFAGRNHSPAADGMETDRNGLVGQERRRVFGNHGVWMINAQDEIGLAVGSALAVLAAGLADGEFVSAERVFRTKVA